jgi:hypothetical protein
VIKSRKFRLAERLARTAEKENGHETVTEKLK